MTFVLLMSFPSIRDFALANQARLSLAFLALLPVLPLFVPWHLDPIRSFHDEWLALTLGVLACLWALPLLVKPLILPRVVMLPLGLMAAIALQIVFMPGLIQAHAQMAMLYLLWASLLMGLTGLLRQQLGAPMLAMWLAAALLVAGLCTTLLEIKFRNQGLLNRWGGVAQANNYGDLLMLSFAAGLYLHTRLSAGLQKGVLAALLICTIGLSLTPSRSVWLYWVSLALISGLWQRRSVRLLAMGFAVYLLMQWVWTLGVFPAPAEVSATERLFQQVGGTQERLHIWRLATQLFLGAPLFGQGFGQFDWAYFQAGDHSTSLVNRLENGHNLILHLAVELGIFPVLFLVTLLGGWLVKLIARLRNSVSGGEQDLAIWLAMSMAVLGIHSLLEYPLWYAEFLGIAAVLLALGDTTGWQVALRVSGRWSLRLMLVVGLLIGSLHEWHYRKLERAWQDVATEQSDDAMRRLFAVCKPAVQQAPLLSPHVAMIYAVFTSPVDPGVRSDLAVLTNTAFHFMPIKNLAYREAELQALNGHTGEALATLDLALKAYPDWADRFLAELKTLSPEDQAKLQALRDRAVLVGQAGVQI
jgi:O-antigen ligase